MSYSQREAKTLILPARSFHFPVNSLRNFVTRVNFLLAFIASSHSFSSFSFFTNCRRSTSLRLDNKGANLHADGIFFMNLLRDFTSSYYSLRWDRLAVEHGYTRCYTVLSEIDGVTEWHVYDIVRIFPKINRPIAAAHLEVERREYLKQGSLVVIKRPDEQLFSSKIFVSLRLKAHVQNVLSLYSASCRPTHFQALSSKVWWRVKFRSFGILVSMYTQEEIKEWFQENIMELRWIELNYLQGHYHQWNFFW